MEYFASRNIKKASTRNYGVWIYSDDRESLEQMFQFVYQYNNNRYKAMKIAAKTNGADKAYQILYDGICSPPLEEGFEILSIRKGKTRGKYEVCSHIYGLNYVELTKKQIINLIATC